MCVVLLLCAAQMLTKLAGHAESVEGVGFCAAAGAAHLCASGAVDGQLIVWDLHTGHMRLQCAHPEAITALHFDSAAAHLFTACMDGLIRCWDALTGAMLSSFSGHQSAVLCLAVVASGGGGGASGAGAAARRLVSGSDEGSCLVFDWNAQTRSKERVGGGEHHEVHSADAGGGELTHPGAADVDMAAGK